MNSPTPSNISPQSRPSSIPYFISKQNIQSIIPNNPYSLNTQSNPHRLQTFPQMSFIHEIYLKVKILFKSERKEIWLAKNTLDGELCAVKLQHTNSESKKGNVRTVLHEGKFLQVMQGHLGVPFLFWAGREEGTGVAMVIMERLGRTLEELFLSQGEAFSLKTVCQLGISLFKMLYALHDKGFTHGNLQPAGLQLGVGRKCNLLYFNDLIDCNAFIKKGKHIKQREYLKRGRVNQFMSMDRLQGFEGSRRDDVQAVIYMLIFFLKGTLPWSKYFQKTIFKVTPPVAVEEGETTMKEEGLSKEETKEETIKFNSSISKETPDRLYTESLCRLQIKVEETTVDQICQGVHPEFKRMLMACKAEEFDDRPDYNNYIRLLEKILMREEEENDGIYDWMRKPDKRLILKREDYQNYGITLPNEKNILEQWYYPFESQVDLW